MRLISVEWALALLLLSSPSSGGRPPLPNASSEANTTEGNFAAPTVVITHGLSLTGTPASWMFELADAARDRLGEGRIVVYQPSSGNFVPCTHPACNDPNGTSGPVLLVMDWAEQSNDVGSGFSEAAAEALFAALMEASRPGADPRVDLSQLHLVGHSRGSVVNSEVAERMVAAGFPPAQMTTLDPHDSGGARSMLATAEELSTHGGVRGGLDDLDVNQEHAEYADRGVVSWQGLGYHDNYWRTGCLPGFLDPDGMFLPGAMNFEMTDVGDAQGNDICHSDVHTWYEFTVSGASAPGGWFSPGTTSCSTSIRSDPLDQTVDGFNGSFLGGITPACVSDPAASQQALFDFSLREGLVNGAFERSGNGNAHAGWSYHGGGGTAAVEPGELVLRADDFREHSRFFVPPGASALRLCYRVEDAGTELSELTLAFCSAETPFGSCLDRYALQTPIAASPTLQCAEASFSTSERGRARRLRLELTGASRGSDPVDVRVQELHFVLPLFFDGFESGGTGSWSASQP